MDRAAGEVEMVDQNNVAVSSAGAPAFKSMKRKRPATDRASATAVGACDDIVGTILARLPARTAIACTALSKHHRNLIRSPEFRSLHCSLGELLPRPHVAYLATASVRRRQEEEHPSSGYYGFHLAGAGLSGGNGDAPAPMRSLAGWRYLGTEYVNTCNGVLLLASEGFSDPCRCTLWNPAVADEAREAPIPKPPSSEKNASVPIVLPGEEKKSAVRTMLWNEKTQFLALGLGYGRRSNTYKLLLCRKDRSQISRTRPSISGKQTCHVSGGTTHHFEYSLVVHSLGGGSGTADTPLLRTVSSLGIVLAYKEEVDQEIMERKSIYMDGTIYFLYWKENVMLAFDVDDETVHTIDMPGERQEDNVQLIEMSSRPCVVIITDRDCIALWRLSTHSELEPIHVISYNSSLYYGCRYIVGVWDCGGVLVLCFECSKKGKLLLYDVAAKKTFRANLPGDLTMKKPEYMLCWGYRPTLVSPGSIVGEINQYRERRRVQSAHITEVIKPLVQLDRRKGQKATLKTVCLMEFLVRIMQKLPHDMQDVVEMPSMDSEEPDLLFKNVV